jgi:hypothetical protein
MKVTKNHLVDQTADETIRSSIIALLLCMLKWSIESASFKFHQCDMSIIAASGLVEDGHCNLQRHSIDTN